MDDYIKRKDILPALNIFKGSPGWASFSVDYIKRHIKELSAADVRPVVRGEWIDECSCSVCHWTRVNEDGFPLVTDYNFCPNCGADMRDKE